jgi:hypothetical protein
MTKEKTVGLTHRVFKEEVREEIFDGEIKASETVDKDNILIQFWTPAVKVGQHVTGNHFGKAIRWRRTHIDDELVYVLTVKVLFQDSNFDVEKRQCICAWRTEMPPESQLPPKTVMRPQKDGSIKRVPNPLWRLKFMEMTKKDRDKLKVIWE